MENKQFDVWNEKKKWLNDIYRMPAFSEREVWWVAIGKNIGVEINGKGVMYARPVLILKKLSKNGFMGIPLTSQAHGGEWYVKFEFQGKLSYAALAQARVLSVARLWGERIGQVSSVDFERICNDFIKLYKYCSGE